MRNHLCLFAAFFLHIAANREDFQDSQGGDDDAVHNIGGHQPAGDGAGGIVVIGGAVDGGVEDILDGLTESVAFSRGGLRF